MRTLRISALLLLLLLAPLTAQAAAGRVTFIEGEVLRTPVSPGPTVPLALDAEVEQGDTIRTSAGAKAELTLEDGSVLRLRERSQLVLEEV